MTNKANTIIIISISLFVAVVSLSGVAILYSKMSTLTDTQQVTAFPDIQGDLQAIERRISQKLEILRQQQHDSGTASEQALGEMELTLLHDKLFAILQQQDDFQQRLAALESVEVMSQTRQREFQEYIPDQLQSMYAGTEYEEPAAMLASAIQTEPLDYSVPDQVILMQINRQVTKYEEVLDTEEFDVTWTKTIKNDVEKMVRQDVKLEGVHVEETECGETLCKIEVFVEQEEEAEEMIHRFMLNRPWDGESFVSFEYEGRGKIFLSRDDRMLP